MKNNYINVLLISWSGLIGWIINYSYHPFMLQYMTLEEFGQFWSLVGLFSILAVLTSGIGLFLTREVSRNISQPWHIKNILFSSMKFFWSIGLGLFLVYILLSPIIANFLHIELHLVQLIGIVIVNWFLGVGVGSSLTWMRKYEFIGLSGITSPITKFIIGWICVSLGLGILWAVLGFIISGVLSFIWSLTFVLYTLAHAKRTGNSQEVYQTFKKNLHSISHFLWVSLFFALLMNGDIILARHLLSWEQAGVYAGVSIVGKFLLYILLSIETVYYAQIMEHERAQLPMHLVRNALLLMTWVSLWAYGVNYFVGTYILGFLNPTLADYREVYLLILVYYCLLAFISIFSKVLIGWWVYRLNFILMALCVCLFFTIYFSHTSDIHSFTTLLVTNIITWFLAIGWLFFYEVKKHWSFN